MKHTYCALGVFGLIACSGVTASESPQRGATAAQNASTAANDDPAFDPAASNPFVGSQFYVNANYARQVEATAARHPSAAEHIRKVEAYPTAVWIDSMERAKAVAPTLKAAASQASGDKPMLTMFVLYDLPNRDCSANSSSGELSVGQRGEERYREFIDVIAQQFSEFPDQRIVAILEPDSLANLVTNLQAARCAQAQSAYRNSIAYAISKLALPNVSVYLDAAHAGWTGWNGNRPKLAQLFGDVLKRAGGEQKIRDLPPMFPISTRSLPPKASDSDPPTPAPTS